MTKNPRVGNTEESFLLIHRVKLHLAMRTGVRLWQAIAPRRLVGSRRLLRASLVSLADLLTLGWMRKHDHLGWGRVFADVGEAALWAAHAPPSADGSRPALLPSLSLALEAGVRDGPAGLLVPAAIGTAVIAVRRVRREPTRITQVLWPTGAALGGWFLARYEQRRRAEVIREVEHQTAARAAAAFRAGQLSVAAEGDSIIDEVQRACVLAQDDGGLALRAEVGAWKASLAESVRAEAVFLADSLLGWQSLHNLNSDLAVTVRFDIDSGRLMLLSRQQSLSLWSQLDDLDLRGPVSVEPIGVAFSRVAGSQLGLKVGPHEIVLPSDPLPRRTVDVLPPQLVLSAYLIGSQALPDLGHVNPWLAGGAALCVLATAVWAHLHLPTAEPHARGAICTVVFAISLPYTVAATLTQDRLLTDGGTPIFPVGGAAQALGIVTASTFSAMSTRQKTAALAEYAAVVIVGWLISPNRRHWQDLAADFAWTLASSGISGGLHDAIDSAMDDLVASLEEDQQRAVDDAFERGARWVHDYARNVVDAALARFALVSDRLPDAVRLEAARRLTDLQSPLGTEYR